MRTLILAAFTLALFGCTKATPEQVKKRYDTHHYPTIFVDRATGCHYLGTDNVYGGLVKREDMTGKHICNLRDINMRTTDDATFNGGGK